MSKNYTLQLVASKLDARQSFRGLNPLIKRCIQGSAKESNAYKVIVANVMDYRYNLIES